MVLVGRVGVEGGVRWGKEKRETGDVHFTMTGWVEG